MYYQTYDANESLVVISNTRLKGGYRVLIQGLRQPNGATKAIRSLVLSPGGTVMKVFPNDIDGREARRFVFKVRRNLIWVPANRVRHTVGGYAVISEWCIEADGHLTPIGGRTTVLYGPGNELIKIIDGEVTDSQAEALIRDHIMAITPEPPAPASGHSHSIKM